MRRHVECDNIILLAVSLEFFRVVAIITVKDKQPIFTLRTRYYMEIEVLNLIHAFLISSPPVIGYYNTLGGRKVILLIQLARWYYLAKIINGGIA